MKYVLRATRFITALFVSLHVSALRASVKLADLKDTKAQARTDQARTCLLYAQDMVRYARQSVLDFRDDEIIAGNVAKNARLAADAEAKYWGREL